LSNDQNNEGKNGGAKQPGPLPGLGGAKPGGAPLPGLGGSKLGAGAPLPGLGGSKPGASLPGMGGVKAAGLPGVGNAPKPVVPPFMQKAEPEKAAALSPEQVSRDPFSNASLPAQRTSFVPDGALLGGAGDVGGAFSDDEAGKTSKPLILGGLILAMLCIGIGFMAKNAMYGRSILNISIRDALVIEYELKKAVKLFDETEGMIGAALQDAIKKKYNSDHIPFLTDNVKRNPINPRIFTERNYKNFDAATVQWLSDYFNKWGQLYELIESHRRETKNDLKALKATGKEFTKLLQTNYGVVFSRDKNKGFLADLVIIGACADKKGKNMCDVQVDTGTFGDARELINPNPGDDALIDEPDGYVVPVGDHSKAGLLKNATQSHFKKYTTRLMKISELMKAMRDIQQNLMGQIAKICSQEPVSFMGGIDTIEEFDEYVANDKNNSSAMSAK